jgi:hypothetical protein
MTNILSTLRPSTVSSPIDSITPQATLQIYNFQIKFSINAIAEELLIKNALPNNSFFDIARKVKDILAEHGLPYY